MLDATERFADPRPSHRFDEDSYVRPKKRSVIDVWVSKEGLTRGAKARKPGGSSDLQRGGTGCSWLRIICTFAGRQWMFGGKDLGRTDTTIVSDGRAEERERERKEEQQRRAERQVPTPLRSATNRGTGTDAGR